jgi:hypothetical protein
MEIRAQGGSKRVDHLCRHNFPDKGQGGIIDFELNRLGDCSPAHFSYFHGGVPRSYSIFEYRTNSVDNA